MNYNYYEAYEPGVFPYQELLCEALHDTPFALESESGNPLTLRLANALQAMNALDVLVRRPLPAQTPSAEAPAVRAADPAAETLEPWEDRQRSVMATQSTDLANHLDPSRIQPFLYQYFNGLCAALDRLAWEVECLFGIEPGSGTWLRFTAPRRTALRTVQAAHPALAVWLTGIQANALRLAFNYLSVFRESGYLPLRTASDETGLRWRVWLPEFKRAGPLRYTVDGLQICRVLLRECVDFMNGTYHMLYRTFQTAGPPPWR